VDWPIILGPKVPTPQVVERPPGGDLAALLAAFDDIVALGDGDAIVRQAVELARERIGLMRVGIFLLDRARNRMLGAWGTDLDGAMADEHHIMYDVSDTDREAFRRAEVEGAYFTVFENCPIVDHRGGVTRVAGRGWVACTPIRSARARIGMMFNDTVLTGAPVDEAKQAHAAILCSLVGTLLDPTRGSLGVEQRNGESAGHPLVRSVVAMLAKNPAMGGKQIAAKLDISLSRLARVFKAQMGMSLVEYRNRLRLERFDLLLDKGRTNLSEAALSSGFGSYAQFHRVFRALRQMTPRACLQGRG
jgi:AraC-like DNA-binding protein